uniref:Uncharacterized protein n=1 Tax=Siphoviridae sp. ctprd3 TaxID=2827943 RepID=A0A8S5TA35_9CAUD|nr:MAG TPA: hypothetical protein [Siphoviridae sp. ctprd3]
MQSYSVRHTIKTVRSFFYWLLLCIRLVHSYIVTKVISYYL